MLAADFGWGVASPAAEGFGEGGGGVVADVVGDGLDRGVGFVELFLHSGIGPVWPQRLLALAHRTS